MTAGKGLAVTSHVARDLLQSAELFKSERVVIWEYVSNGLQYVDSGVSPHVKVSIDRRGRRIAIADNGRGMDRDGLSNFFVMHGENQDRKQGRPGRGRFGTGKSAAFGIAGLLRVTSVKDGRRTVVELTRKSLEESKSGDPVPLSILRDGESSAGPNGTLIEIEQVHAHVDVPSVIRYIERHLARERKDAKVFVNDRLCEFMEPPIAETYRFKPEGPLLEVLGEVTLLIKQSKMPLEEDSRGIAVFANGVWMENTYGGMENKEFVNYLFGEIDVPRLDTDQQKPAAFDQSRSMQLNPLNPLVLAIHAFIGAHVDDIRRRLVEEERERRETEEARRLNQEAARIAEILNEDFDDLRRQLQMARTATGLGPESPTTASKDPLGELLTAGGDEPAVSVDPAHSDGTSNARKARESVAASDEGPPQGTGGSPGRSGRPSARGGFQVQFEPEGLENDRANYRSRERTIVVNLDHPQIAAALGKGTTDDLSFRRLAYEAAFVEYALAISFEMVQHDQFLDMNDPLDETKRTINRLVRKAASLYGQDISSK